MKELKKVLVWANDEQQKQKQEARLLFSDLNGYCVVISKIHYQSYLKDGLKHVAVVPWKHWEEIKEPKMRPMNQKEIWYAIQNMKHPIVVTTNSHEPNAHNIEFYSYGDSEVIYLWAELFKDGTHGEWNKFEAEE